MGRSYRCTDTSQVAAIKQVRVAILAQGDDKTGGCCTGHIHQQWTGATEIGVAHIE
jgi:hypothetical protein